MATLVRVTGHGAVCLSDARAIVDPAAAHRRLAAELSKQAIAVEGVAFTRLVRDPARSVTDPPPQACRLLAQALGAATPVSAPLQLSREPTAAWFAVTSTGDVVTDAAAVLLQAVQQGHAVAGPPRLLLDDAFALASIAVPVEPP